MGGDASHEGATMNQRRVLTITGVLALAVSVCSEALAFSASYDQTVSTPDGETLQSKVVTKDRLFRIEGVYHGVNTVIIRNADGVYLYEPKERAAVILPAGDPSVDVVQQAQDFVGYLQERNAVKVGSETVRGYPCDVYEFTDPTHRGRTKAWVWQEKSFPVRMEMDLAKGRTVVELRNIQFDVAANDALFQLPPGVEVLAPAEPIDLNRLMQEGH